MLLNYRQTSNSADSDAPTTSEWSTILLPTNVQHILEVWGIQSYLPGADE